MAPQTLQLIKAPLFMPLHPRVLFHRVKAILLVAILIQSAFQFVKCETCFENGIQSIVENKACDRDGFNAGTEIGSYDEKGTDYLPEEGPVRPSLESICSDSNLFCFPSTLLGYFAEDDRPKLSQHKSNSSWSSDYGIFKLSTGQVVSCSSNFQSGSGDSLLLKLKDSDKLFVSSFGAPLHGHKSLKLNKQGDLDGFKFSHVEVSPPNLDWGHASLYAPSFAFLTVANTHSDRNLYLYEPFSTNSQFYPCNFSEVLLKPGEAASFCFMFLPTWLGISTTHLVLKTSFGEFLIQAKGFGVESPYKVQLSGSWNRNLFLFNPFDETLSVEEVTVAVSVPFGNDSYLTKTVCKLETSEISDKFSFRSTKNCLDVKNYQVGMALIAVKPRKDWSIAPGSTENILDLNLLHNYERNAYGSVSVKLLRSSQGKSDTIVVPFEAGKLTNHLDGPVLASLEKLQNGPGEATVFALLLRNRAPYLLNVIKIEFVGEGSELFQIKYLEGLILFPGSLTQVAVISYVTAGIDMNLGCFLTILTNDSISHQVEIRCEDIITIPSRYDAYSENDEQAGNSETKNATIGSSRSNVNLSPVSKVVEATEPDEMILDNWKSQATSNEVSILDINEVIYPVVQIGTHHSKWITVKNPSPYPVVMQLILNSGEIVNECKETIGFSDPSSSSVSVGEYSLQTRYGFSLSKAALTEAYVLPYETASFGPIVFHPTKKCQWKSSALIRNNLSGVEWVYLRGLGGSFSLSVFEDYKAVQILEFKFNLPSPLNLSLDNIHQKDTAHTCSTPLLKELYAKNTGDVPLHVKRIDISGTKCALDGFSVNACKSFSLQPGESSKILISYLPDFSSVTIRRDLELALGGGILVIPMKANLPLDLFTLCKRSMSWTRLKRLSYLILFAAGLILILFFYTPPISMPLPSQDYSTKDRKNIAIVRQVGKTYKNKNSMKFYASSNINGSTVSVREDVTLVASKQGITGQQVKPTLEYQETVNESKDGNLTVKIGKDKGKRRKKKKGSVVGLNGTFEVSSSQSGNSTPSSPSSPLTYFTPKRIYENGTESLAKSNNFGRFGTSVRSSEKNSFRAQEKPSPPPMKMPGKPVLLQSATFPSPTKKISQLVSTSKIAPHARAPGSKLINQKEVESEVKSGFRHQFEYDIWGDHLFGRQPLDRSKRSCIMTSSVVENPSDSFFVSGPQTLCSFEEGY